MAESDNENKYRVCTTTKLVDKNVYLREVLTTYQYFVISTSLYSRLGEDC